MQCNNGQVTVSGGTILYRASLRALQPNATPAFRRLNCVHCREINSFATRVTTCTSEGGAGIGQFHAADPGTSLRAKRSGLGLSAPFLSHLERPEPSGTRVPSAEEVETNSQCEARCAGDARTCRGTGRGSPRSSRSGTGSAPGFCLRSGDYSQSAYTFPVERKGDELVMEEGRKY